MMWDIRGTGLDRVLLSPVIADSAAVIQSFLGPHKFGVRESVKNPIYIFRGY